MRILIKNVQQPLNPMPVDVFIDGHLIKKIGEGLTDRADRLIDGSGKAVVPGFVNGHTHAAMTLFRGMGDDLPLEQWLNEKIWPAEARLTDEQVYWGVKLACLEMIKTGTTCFNDMYTHYPATLRAVEEMGLRAVIGATLFDHFNPAEADRARRQVEQYHALPIRHRSRITFALAPHAIYTVSGSTLQWVNDYSKAHQLPIHLHAAETQTECRYAQTHFGESPVRYLHRLGLLSPRLTLAHCLWVDDEEIRLLADHGVNVVHNPCSNLKLASGDVFKYEEMKRAGIRVAIGTDGSASSNSLDMLEAAKIASLLQKGRRGDPTAMPAPEALRCITRNGAAALQVAAGEIAENRLADLSLLNLQIPAFTPNHHFTSNLIYAANGSCVHTVICDGKILMENGYVPGEEEILKKVHALTPQ